MKVKDAIPYLSIVVPAYREVKNLNSTLPRIEAFIKKAKYEIEVIIVDDGSDDSTSDVVSDYIKGKENFRLIINPHKGKGYAVRTGVLDAGGKLVYIADADLATPIEDVERFIFWVSEHKFDIVIGSREGLGAKRIGEPIYRHIMGRVFNFLTRIILGLSFRDTQCGFKLFKGNVAKEIFEKQILYNEDSRITIGGKVTAYDVEILFLAEKLGYKVKELPVTWTFGKNTKVNPVKNSLENFLDVVKVKINDIRGLYD